MLAWGINDFGQLGNGSTFYETSPTKVVGLEGVRIADIAAGGWHSLALTTEGGTPCQELTKTSSQKPPQRALHGVPSALIITGGKAEPWRGTTAWKAWELDLLSMCCWQLSALGLLYDAFVVQLHESVLA